MAVLRKGSSETPAVRRRGARNWLLWAIRGVELLVLVVAVTAGGIATTGSRTSHGRSGCPAVM